MALQKGMVLHNGALIPVAGIIERNYVVVSLRS